MIILIDGYNILKRIFSVRRKISERERLLFIKRLGAYKIQKNVKGLEIIIVFDAGPTMHATRLVTAGIVVVYSGTNSSADAWIMDFALQRLIGKELVLVTDDNKLRQSCLLYEKVTLVGVSEFYDLLLNFFQSIVIKDRLICNEQGFYKYKHTPDDFFNDDSIDLNTTNSSIDVLMEMATESIPLDKNDNYSNISNRKSSGYSFDKKQLLRKKIIKKLL